MEWDGEDPRASITSAQLVRCRPVVFPYSEAYHVLFGIATFFDTKRTKDFLVFERDCCTISTKMLFFLPFVMVWDEISCSFTLTISAQKDMLETKLESETHSKERKRETMRKQITAIIVGAGHRAILYSLYALEHPDELKIVGVADPDPIRRKKVAEMHGFGEEMCFKSAEELAARPKLADAVINGTMDRQHVPTAVPLLRAGYDMLLEKPFAISEEEVNYLYKVVKETGRKVMICHVLRYAPFYVAIKQRLLSGEIGDIINIQATEHVSYHHLAVSFVRGKWGNEEKCGAPMLLAKCCHDMDLIMWLKSGVSPKQIASFGSDFQFDPAKKPAGAGKRCLVDCQCEETCLYSAKKHYLDHPDRWAFYVWDCLENIEEPTLEDKRKSLMTDNIHGRCVWDCEHTVVDHQSVLMNFADGATATLNMIGGTAKPERNIHIIGTKGEIKGVFDDSVFTVRTIDTASEKGWNEEVVDLKIGGDKSGMTGSHGGGDLRLVEDFVHVLQGEEPSISCTTIKDSIHGHLGVFCAERARKENAVITMPDIK